MNIRKNSQLFLIGLVLSLIIAVFLSPFASPDPDGLDRVAEDLQFSKKEDPNALGNKLPSARIFDGYALKGVPQGVATPLAGFLGTLATFGIAWGIGKLIIPKSQNQE